MSQRTTTVRRTAKLQVPLTPAELAQIDRAAELDRRTRADFARTQLLAAVEVCADLFDAEAGGDLVQQLRAAHARGAP